MKKPLLRHVIYMTRLFTIAFIIQCLTMGFILARNGNDQVKSIEEGTVYLSLNDVKVEKVFKELETHSTQASLSFNQLYLNIHAKKSDKDQMVSDVDVTVTGTVTDTNGEPIPGVTVSVPGTTIGTATDLDGKYVLSVPEGTTLAFSFIGFETRSIAVGDRSVIDVILNEDMASLDEVVVVGYGTQKKETLTGSIVSVDGDALQRSPSPNISNSLAGRLPGLVVVTRTGEPGNDASLLRIRGVNTLGDNSPLIVVDGIPNRSFDRLDPATIESVTVLKDASAAIYGAQAANGVILVTTKRGEIGEPTIQLNLSQGWNSPTVLPEMADAATYTQLVNEIFDYAGRPPRYTAEEIQKYRDGSDPWGYPNTDWFKETIEPWTPQRYGNLSLSGGVEKIKYFVSVGSNFQDGMYRNGATNYSQVDFRSNLDAKISDHIRLSFDLAGRQENRNYSGVGTGGGAGALNVFWAMNRTYPYYPARWPNGLPGPDVEYGANPTVLVTDATGYDREKRYVMQSNTRLVIDIPWVTGLSITGNAAIDKTFSNRKIFQKPWYLYNWDGATYDENNEPVLIASKKGFSDPRLTQSMVDAGITTFNALINYERTFAEKHDVKVLFGTERISGDSMNFNAFRRHFTSEALDQMNAGGDLLKNNGGSASEEARLNYFGRVNYSLSSKYLAEFVWRYDGSYIFPEESRFGFFPGVSLGWRVSEEDFWKNSVPFVDDLKIRGSWGRTGNDRIVPYQFMTTYGYNSTYLFNENVEQKTLRALRIPNPNVTWEVANQTNIGFDAQMLNGKIMVTADYFYNLRTDILWFRNASVPTSTGLSLPRENIGEVINQGFEMQLGYTNEVGDFYYQVSANGSYAKNKIKFWDETPGVPEYQQSTGQPMNARLYYQAIGVFVDEAAVEAYPHWSGARPGDIIFEDVNEDGVIDGLDRVRSDKTSIPIFTGGFNLDLGYKNFYASVLFQGAAGAERAYRTFSGGPGNGNFLWNDIKDRWTEENPSSTHPRAWDRAKEYWMTDGEPNNTYWVRSSDYLRLKNVEIGYNIPSNIIERVGVENLRIYASGQNLFTMTGMTDFDPESPDEALGSIWVNSQVYPLNKTINLGLSLTF
ncbi:MAG: TonB-dependent receptor [Anditalea sp.]